MDLPINFLAIGLAALAAMVVGVLWYRPLFGRPWRRLAGLDARPSPQAALIYPVALVANGVTAFVISFVANLAFAHAPTDFLLRALFTAFFLWLGFSAARALIVTLFESTSFRLYLIHAGHNLAVALVMAVIIGLLG